MSKYCKKREETKEDLCNLIKNIGKTLEIPVETSEIRNIHRGVSKTSPESPIIVDFTTVIKKDRILNSY